MGRLVTLNDVLRAWQAGQIGYREAMRLSGADTLDDLYEAAELSDVPIRTTFTPEELRHGREVAPLLRSAARRDRVPERHAPERSAG